jgi:MATE family multidrug resistance protein
MTSTTPPSAANNNIVSSSIWQSSAWRETQLLLNLAIPTVVIQLGGVLPNFLVASYVGRSFGAVYLDGFTLANLMGNLCNLTLLQGLYTSADTLGPQAFGAGNHKEVGYLAIRGYVASLVVLVPMNVLLFFGFSQIMVYVGEDVEAATVAHQWYQIYACGLPFYALYMVAWKFLSAQEIMYPLVLVCIVCCAIVLPLSLEFFTKWWGFLGSAWAIFAYQFSEAVLLIGYLYWKRPHTPGTWPGLQQWRGALQWEPFQRYFYLGIGGMLASSEWIYWEFLSLLIGTLGVIPLSVHTVPTQVLMVGFMFPMGIGIALAVRLGATLPKDVKQAQHLTIGCFCGSAVLFAFMAIWVYVDRRRIFSIFTSEPDVLEGCERIWWKVSIFYFNLSIYGINMGIATGLGMQWRFGIVTFICLWGFSLPGMYYWAIVQGGGLEWAWSCIYPPYIAMNLYFAHAFWRADWEKIRIEIRIREGMDEPKNFVEMEEELVRPANRTVPSYGSVDHESLKLLPKNGH